MGPTHALSGAAAWIGGSAIIEACGTPVPGAEIAVGAAVCAGAALLPDIDHPSSTVARSFGPVSVALSHGVDAIATVVFNVTRTSIERPRESGHRTLTHTTVFAMGLGGLVGAACSIFGKAAAAVVLFILLGLALRGLLGGWARRQGWAMTTLVTSGVSLGALVWLPADRTYAVLGVAVTLGAFMHCLGDMITKQGCPLAWPLVHRGKRWWEFALPSAFRIRAGGTFEKNVLLPVLSAVILVGSMAVTPPAHALVMSVWHAA
ncbi:metal-dependent hydrolase [Streptomyces sp. NPDC051572]|uniref:metal-dependent hydrolase n=1 Tax=Streptomyces sp. NPDC051572 TaxID=3155802 RepID=UPI00344D2AD1